MVDPFMADSGQSRIDEGEDLLFSMFSNSWPESEYSTSPYARDSCRETTCARANSSRKFVQIIPVFVILGQYAFVQASRRSRSNLVT